MEKSAYRTNGVSKFYNLLEKQGFLILDGALATELESRGADLKHVLWSAKILIERPELIRSVHLDYFRAGADVATTASYQATIPGLVKYGLAEGEARSLLQTSVRLAQQAREVFMGSSESEGRFYPLIAASIGPYGAFLADGSEYRGAYGLSRRALIDFHRPRLEALLEAEPDLLALETIPCRVEAEVLLELLSEYPEARAWISFSARNGSEISEGQPFAEVAALADASPQMLAVGINCTAPSYIEPLLLAAGQVTDKPLVAYPNSGEGWDAVRKCWIPGHPSESLSYLGLRWYAAGGRLIGGCCRTTPDDIRQLRQSLTAGLLQS